MTAKLTQQGRAILSARSSLRLAFHHLVEDHIPIARAWAAYHLHWAIAHAVAAEAQLSERLLEFLGTVPPSPPKEIESQSAPDGTRLQIVGSELKAALDCFNADGEKPKSKWLKHRFCRDLGIVVVFALVAGGAYRLQSGRSLNLWSNQVSAMDVKVESATQGWGQLEIDRTTDKVPIYVGGKSYSRGLGTHAVSAINISFTKSGSMFSGSCGYPDSVKSARIVCAIDMGGREVFRSEPLDDNHRIVHFSLPLKGATKATLKVTTSDGSITAAHAVWVDLYVKE